MSNKADKAKLDAGAAKIHKAKKEAGNAKAQPNSRNSKKVTRVAASPMEPVVIPESTRPIQDIIRERVTVLDGHIGLKLADNTPIEESLRILDWTTSLSKHVGFMIGDVLNFSEAK